MYRLPALHRTMIAALALSLFLPATGRAVPSCANGAPWACVASQLTAEESVRMAADQALQDSLDALEVQHQADIEALQGQIDSLLAALAQEVQDRVAADADLAVEIDTDIAAHALLAHAHHVKYDDAEALAAVGPHAPDLSPRLEALEEWGQYFSLTTVDDGFGNGRDTVLLAAANLQVVNGSGSTEGIPNGLGNVVVGYNRERASSNDRSGSHVLVVGSENDYSGFGGLVVGRLNSVSGAFASVHGGQENIASADYSCVGGGLRNTASGLNSVVSGGFANLAGGENAAVSGGQANQATGRGASVSGGTGNVASGVEASISGGNSNVASGFCCATVSGGLRNVASNRLATVSGGRDNIASGNVSTVSGGADLEATDEVQHLP